MSIISHHCETALETAVLASCAEVTRYLQQPLSSSALDDFRQPVLDIVYRALQKHAREQTALRSAAVRLPDELLVDTFSHLGVFDRIRATTVCHRWRAVSLGAPARLWSTVPALANLDAWNALLDRARDAPVTLERIRLHKRTFDQVFVILRQHMHHIKSLDLLRPILWGDETDFDALTARLDSILELPAPALEHIHILRNESRHQPLRILAAPELRSVKLHKFSLSCLASCATSSALRVLVIDVLSDEQFPLEHWPLLSSFPALEVLAVSLGCFPNLPVVPPLSITLPPTLKHLRLDIDYAIFRSLIHSLIPKIGRIPLWEIRFTYRSLPTFQDVLAFCPGVFASVAFSCSQPIDFMITERTGEQRVFENVQPDGKWLQMLSGAERLCCTFRPEHSRAPHPAALIDPALAFAALRELTFDVSDPYASHSGRQHALEWPYGPCPLMRVVRVRAFGHPVRVQLPSVVAVLSRFMPLRKLALLEFDNVDIVSDAGADDALSSLHAFAETVSMRTDGESWPECHLLWNKSWDELAYCSINYCQ